MKKRLLPLLLTLCMLTGTMYLPAHAETDADTDPATGLVYEILTAPADGANGTVKLRAVSPKWTDPVTEIPATLTLDGATYDVTEIVTAAFTGQTSLVTADLSNVQRIAAFAFEGCTSLMTVTAPNAVSIGRYAFRGCTALETVSALNVSIVEGETFSGCTSLTAIDLPRAETIDVNAFNKCEALASVNAPKVTTIKEKAFIGCSSLTAVDFPKAEAVGEYAFNGCTALVTASLPKAETLDERAFDNCPALESVDLSSVKTIGDRVFNACVKLAELDLPMVESLGSFALSRCESLVSLSMPNAKTLGARALGGCDALTEITFGAVAPTLANNNALGTTSADRVLRVPEGATGYDVAPFAECTVTEVVVPGAEIYFYADANHDTELPPDTILPVGTKVYYEILCFEGVFCTSVFVNSNDVDRDFFTVPYEAPLGELLKARFILGGDLDESGAFDNRDVTALLRYLAKWDVSPDLDAADYNRDENIDNRDTTTMLRYLAGWFDAPVTDAPAAAHTVYSKKTLLSSSYSSDHEPWEVTVLSGVDAFPEDIAEDDLDLFFPSGLLKTGAVAMFDVPSGARVSDLDTLNVPPSYMNDDGVVTVPFRMFTTIANEAEARAISESLLRATLPETTVFYNDFGAVGDGVTDDFLALQAAHAYANEHGYAVRAIPGAVYYLGPDSYYKSIVIQTSTDFTGAEIIIDDSGINLENESRARQTPPFKVTASNAPIDLSDRVTTLAKGTTTLDLDLGCDAFIYVEDSTTKQFIRTGGNLTDGDSMRDCFVLYADGTVDENTPIIWDFNTITSIRAYLMDAPITIKGGEFTTIANQGEKLYNYFWRGINVERSNVTLDGLEHYVTGELLETGSPYHGFIQTKYCANVTVENVIFTARYIYETMGTGGFTVLMGSYDFVIDCAANITVRGCRQSNDLFDADYWGIMQTRFCKNSVFENCTLNRIDAHQGVTNQRISNCLIGYRGINAIGHGDYIVENTAVMSTYFTYFREDYGSTWNGDVLVKDCYWQAGSSDMLAGINNGDHDYGYECYMPTTVTVDGLHVEDAELVAKHGDNYVGIFIIARFTDLSDESKERPYLIKPTERVSVKNFRSASGVHWYPLTDEPQFADTEFLDLDKE